MVEGSEPAVEEAACWRVGDEANLFSEAGQVNENGGMNGTDVVSLPTRHRSVRRIAEHDGVDLVRIVVLVCSRGSLLGAGRAGSSGVVRRDVSTAIVAQGIEDRAERTGSSHDSNKDGSGTERLTPGDIETGSGNACR
jgi:hypothetical protein